MSELASQPHRHRIRLQGPWEVLPAGKSNRIEVRLPATWESLLGSDIRPATFFRKFNTPTNLVESDQVLIRLPQGIGRVVNFQLNGIVINENPDALLEFDISRHLQLNNELAICIEHHAGESTEAGGLSQPIVLEIISAG